MAYQNLRLTGGVVVNETPSLNEAGLSSSQLIRLKPDPNGITLVEKLGGWAKFLSTQITSVVRSLLAWEDTNANRWIAFGTSSTTASQLLAYQCSTNGAGITTAQPSSPYTLTPQYLTASVPVKFQTTAGSSTVTITDNLVTGLSTFDDVFISTPVSVGGLILFGQYSVASDSGNQYTIQASNILGLPAYAAYSTIASPLTVTGGTYSAGSIAYTYATQSSPPFIVGENINVTGVIPIAWNGSCIVTACTTATVTVIAPMGASGTWTSGGSLSNYGVTPIYTTTAGSALVTVTFPDHGQTVGSTFDDLNNSIVGASETLSGNYIVTSVPNSNTFTITVAQAAGSAIVNYANAYVVTGGSSTNSVVTLQLAGASTLQTPVLTITGGSSTTSAVTLSWNSSIPYFFTVGATIAVSGVNPATWDGSYVVTASTSSSVTYSLSSSAASWAGGGTVRSPPFNIGAQIHVSGTTVTGGSPNLWNGNFTVTGSTVLPYTVSYALSGPIQAWISGGVVSDIGGDTAIVYNITAGPPGTGSPTQTTGLPVFASFWSLDNWGGIFLASPVGFMPIPYPNRSLPYNPIYAWDPALQQPLASVIAAAPPAMNGFFVAMPQRQIISWGSTFSGVIDPLLVRWCDISNYNVWVAQITNQAGSYRLSTGSVIVGALQVQLQGFLWTDVSLWTMQYIGQPYVYSFNQVGKGCGLIARNAMGILNNLVYWMGARQFFFYSSEGVQSIPCPVWDVVFQNLDIANVSKITCAVNSLFNEVTWFYPVVGGNGENAAYVKLNVLLNQWDFGSLGRTAWIDNSVLGPPIGYDPVNQYLYQHEISPDADGAAMSASVSTGYFAISEGMDKSFVDEIWPDFKWGYYGQAQTANVRITFNACDFPGQTPTVYGPYTVQQSTTWFNTRIRARLVSMTISSTDAGSWWRFGNLRYRLMPDGRY